MDQLKHIACYRDNISSIMKYVLFALALTISASTSAQSPAPAGWAVNGYLEAYYSYDINKPINNTKSSFLYSYNRNNETNINLGFIKVSYNDEQLRTNIALATGTYMNANYAAEPGILKNIYEANVGVKLSKTRNLWLDAGVLPSHIGWEGATGKDYPSLTRSIAAENSPYFETGLKVGYTTKNEKWFLSALVLNGWQRIQRIDGNTTPAFGTQVTYKPSAGITLNSSSFIGSDKPDSVRQMRYFHDLFGSFQLSNKFSITAGFDIGMEQKEKGSGKMHTWYTPVVIARYTPGKLSISTRVEYFSDKDGVLITTGTIHGFSTTGYSANVDYKIGNYALWRFELRGLHNHDAIFQKHGAEMQKNSLFFTTALAIGF